MHRACRVLRVTSPPPPAPRLHGPGPGGARLPAALRREREPRGRRSRGLRPGPGLARGSTGRARAAPRDGHRRPAGAPRSARVGRLPAGQELLVPDGDRVAGRGSPARPRSRGGGALRGQAQRVQGELGSQ